MPRIAVAAGALVLITFSIGFNMVRYPKVWEMVGIESFAAGGTESLAAGGTASLAAGGTASLAAGGTESHLPQPVQAPQLSSVVEPAPGGPPEPVVKTMIPWQTTPVPLAEQQAFAGLQYGGVPEGRGSGVSQAQPPATPIELEASAKYASAKYVSAGAERDVPELVTSQRPLVPLERSTSPQDTAVRSGWDPEIRRLPPVDQAAAEPSPPPQLPKGQIPFYPSAPND